MEPTTFKGKSVVKWALTLGIIIILNLFFSVAIETAYPRPDYSLFCEPRQVNELYEDELSCVAVGGQWNEHTLPKGETGPLGWCNVDFSCATKYEEASHEYERTVFVTLIVLGALSLGAAYLVSISPAVSAGLSYGGVLTFVIAAIRYWGEAGDLVRLAIVGIALIVLIAAGVRYFKE